MPTEPIKTEKTKSFNCGDPVFVMIEGKPEATIIRNKNILESFSVAEKVETFIEYFVKGSHDAVPVDKIFATKAELVNSL